MSNKIEFLLSDLGVIDAQSVTLYHPTVRDRDDVSVLRCQKSGVIFLSSAEHMDISHYESKKDFKYWGGGERKAAVLAGHEDAHRRYEQFNSVIANKKWLDVGTGAGGILDLLSPVAAQTLAVEPQEDVRECLKSIGYEVYSSVVEIAENDIQVVTLFHVFEHLVEPIKMLEDLKSKMKKGGTIVIEVPHAKDLLLSFFGLDSFKSFTFWSEHLILHTRESLKIFLEAAGFSNISIKSYQRYPLANHLHWLAKEKPGGHILWNHLRTPALDVAYNDMLSQHDCTDTLIATATNG